MRKLPESEKDIQKNILHDLKLRGAVGIKINNVGIRKPNGSYIPVRQKGVSDIVFCLKGKFGAVEVKSTGKEPSDYQLEFLEQVRKAGGYATWVDNMSDYFTFIEGVK